MLLLCTLGEGLDVDMLDNICQELTNNTDAYFVTETGIQFEFPCRIGDEVYIFGNIEKPKPTRDIWK